MNETLDAVVENKAPRQAEGLHAHRLKQDNPREVAFSETWREETERGLLHQLFLVPCKEDDPDGFQTFGGSKVKKTLGDPTERDKIVAATVIQWLGSNVGMGFLHEVCRKIGYGLHPKPSPHI